MTINSPEYKYGLEEASNAQLLLADTHASLAAAWVLSAKIRRAVEEKISASGAKLDAHQMDLHAYAWMATYVQALEQMQHWAVMLHASGEFGELEYLILLAAFGEYLAQLIGGLAMSQVEIARARALGVSQADLNLFQTQAANLVERGTEPAVRLRIAELIMDGFAHGDCGALGLDETMTMVRETFRRFSADQVSPYCHEWHLRNELIPLPVIHNLADMGVFGLTISESYGGQGMGKLAMAVVSEELSRGYIGVGSLGTRSEIAGELIRLGGTETQKQKFLPRIVSGEILPTAVFTEPNSGSDLASLTTRAVRDGDVYRITGAKTWITHASRSDLMILLARTGAVSDGYNGLSMFLAEKPRGTDADPFPAPGMVGGEIEVLGYRGMKEYELGFDAFEVQAESLLGGVEGQGFKQLMETFESARIQTAARAVGVAQNALDLGFRYAVERVQFGKPLIAHQRIGAKLGWMAVETMIARQLTYFAAREKDGDRRCDIEAGMAKLLAARVAWANADNALQIHGGNGYALEYPISRVLCDARILNVFEGTAEIQAQVIARGLLSRNN